MGVAVCVGVAVAVDVAVGVGVGGIAYSVSPAVFPLTVAYSSQSQHVPDLPGLLIIQYPVDVFFPTTTAVCPTSSPPTRSYCIPGPVRQLVSVLTETSGTVGVEVGPCVGVGPGVEVNSGVDVNPPGCNKSDWAVMVSARSISVGASVLCPLGRLQAVRETINRTDINKSDLFLSIFSPFHNDYDISYGKVKEGAVVYPA